MARYRKAYNTFVVESFTNDIGQTLNPGDKVVAVTTGYGHRVNTFTGVFAGVFRSPKGEITGTRVTDVPVTWKEREYTEDGEHEETRMVYNRNKGTYGGYDYIPTGKRYNLVPKVKYRKSALQRNRVFKIETPLTEVKI